MDLQAPTLITDERLKASKEKKGIQNYFTPIQTIEAGTPDTSIQAESGQTFEISVEIVDTYISPGTVLHIFTSQDGENRESLFTTCIVDDNYMCTFETPHLTLFALGTIMWNNMEFVNQDFWNTNPTDGQIIDAYFGTGGNPSAYTQYRNT